MSLTAAMGRYDVTSTSLVWFGTMLLFGLLFTFAISPRRCRAVGGVRFMAGRTLILGAALFGVIVVRGAVARGHLEAGQNLVFANLNGFFWGLVFAIFARPFLILFPPTAWLLKEHRRARQEAFLLRAMFAGAPAR